MGLALFLSILIIFDSTSLLDEGNKEEVDEFCVPVAEAFHPESFFSKDSKCVPFPSMWRHTLGNAIIRKIPFLGTWIAF